MLLDAAEPAKLSTPLGQKVHALDSTRAARGFRLQSSYNQLIIVALLHKQILRSNLSQIICSISILFHFHLFHLICTIRRLEYYMMKTKKLVQLKETTRKY